MLQRAGGSLFPLAQMTELNFSGSSVARGAKTSAIRPAGTPTDFERCSTALTKKWAPTAITAIVPTTCAATAQVGASDEEGHRVRFSGRSDRKSTRLNSSHANIS